MKIPFVLLFGFILTSLSISYAQEVAEWTPAQVDSKLKANSSVILLDVRTPDEFAEGHIANAINIDVNSSSFEQQCSKLDKKKSIYVYCLAGVRSKKAAIILKKKGYQVVSMSGGIKAWTASGRPVTKGR